ncbi:hypothetical protein AAG570_006276 [Ranatra chinensis]|uniref:Pyrroline-5-carboxylate reductase n=1 Tax=Ranatra chinensis TaxID=642074 RepID=A0ABD0YTI7_9HEMI
MKIGFIGGGKIAQALANGLIKAGVTNGNKILVSCAPEDLLSAKAFKEIGAEVTFKNSKIVENNEVVIMAVKPSIVPIVLQDIHNSVSRRNLILSVAMGVTLKFIEQSLPAGSRVIRAMPNAAAEVQKAASVFVCGSNTIQNDAQIAFQILEAVGTCNQVEEDLLDPITALSGSGPAYIYNIIEAMADGAVKKGLPRDLAYSLTAQTVVGAGQMVLSSGLHPAILKDNVTSPAGIN